MSEGKWPIENSMPSNDDELLAPLQIGNYRLVRRIGDGGMGIVYKAVQERPERHVALKLMRQAVMTREQLHRFERESELLGSLVHPNIAQVYEAGTHKEGSLSIPFYAMELVPDALSVTAYAKRMNLSRRQRVEMMVDICGAIQYAHDHAILHRDLKPGNILVTPTGTAKVIDLGVSRLLSEASITLTRTDQLVGTIQYMAPEQLSETSGAPSVQWDVYSLGVVLYELIVGALPYELPVDSALRAARALERATPRRPRRVDPSITKDLESVMIKALARDPVERYASVGALASDLANVLEAKPVRARSTSGIRAASQALALVARRHRVVTIAALVLTWFLICVSLQTAKTLIPLDSRWPAFALGHLTFIREQPLEQVRMVVIRNDLTTVATRLGLDRYDPSVLQAARPIYGAIVSKLAKAKPKAIALDVSYEAPSQYDAPFLDALSSAESAGVPIITAAVEWNHRGGPGVLPELASKHRVGYAGVAILHEQVQGVISMWVDELEGDEPGFVMQAVAAARNLSRETGLYLDLQGRVRAKAANDPVVARISRLHGEPEQDGIPRGFAANFVQLPSDAALAASEMSFEDVLNLDDSTLNETFAGRVIVIGDGRPDRDAKVEVIPGRFVTGYQFNATAIDQALRDQVVHYPVQTAILGFWMNAENAFWIVAYAILALTGLMVRSWRISGTCTSLFLIGACALPIVAFTSRGILLHSPTTPLLLVFIVPLIFGVRRWTARQSI